MSLSKLYELKRIAAEIEASTKWKAPSGLKAFRDGIESAILAARCELDPGCRRAEVEDEGTGKKTICRLDENDRLVPLGDRVTAHVWTDEGGDAQ